MPIPVHQISDSRFSLQFRYPFITELLAQADVLPASRDVAADVEVAGDELEAATKGDDGNKDKYVAFPNSWPPNPPGSNPPSESATWIVNIGNFISENITAVSIALVGIGLALTGLATAILKFNTGFIKFLKAFVKLENLRRVFKEPDRVPTRNIVVDQFEGLALARNEDKKKEKQYRQYGALFRGLPYSVREFIAKTAIEDHWDAYTRVTKNVFIFIEDEDSYVPHGLPFGIITKVAGKMLREQNIPALETAARNWVVQRITDSIDFGTVMDQLIAVRPEVGQMPYKAQERLTKTAIENWRDLDVSQRATHVDPSRPYRPGQLPQPLVSNFMSQITDEHLESLRRATSTIPPDGRARRKSGSHRGTAGGTDPLARRPHHRPLLSRTRFARHSRTALRGATMARRMGVA